MKLFQILTFSLGILLLQACATADKEVPTDHLDNAPSIERHHGKIINIREVKKDASFGKRFAGAFAGALIGGQIGGGKTKNVTRTAGAFIGADVMNKKYGEVLDRLILKDSKGREYQCLVHGHGFKVGDKVVFTVVEGHVSAIIHDAQ